MKTTTRIFTVLLLTLTLLLCAVACKGQIDASGMWANATYKEDTTVGEGAKTIRLTVKVEEQSVVITVKTDAETVGAALTENNLITGDPGEFGLYIKSVNGIAADYDRDGYYWAFYEGSAYAMAGVDQTVLTDGGEYTLACEK